MSQQLLMGNEAIGIAALHAGVNVACGYPGTPSTEIIETIVKRNPGDVYVEWSTNEKAAMEVAAGASYSGARVLVTMKQVGMNVAADPFMSLVYVGTKGGLVAVVADDPGPISSQTEQDTRQFAQFAHVPCLDPVSPEDAYDMIGAAFELSEKHQTPVIVRPTTRVDHGCSTIDVPDLKPGTRNPIEGFIKDPRFVIFPRRSYLGHLEIIERMDQMAVEFERSPFNRTYAYRNGSFVSAGQEGTALLGIMTGGVSDAYAREAIALVAQAAFEKGVALPDFEVLNVGTPVPFPAGLAARFMAPKERVLVFEELEPVLERAALETCAQRGLSCEVLGKLTKHTTLAGENTVEDLARQLAAFLGLEEAFEPVAARLARARQIEVELPVRPPTLCAGCPHRSSFLAVKEAVGNREAVYAGDIGCYTLGNAKPLETTDTCLCMGAGITVAQGLSVASRLKAQQEAAGTAETAGAAGAAAGSASETSAPEPYHFAFIGDSTFFASGLTGVANAIYNNHRMCLIVLDNSTTAMTGSQPHPGIGDTLMGQHNTPIPIRPVLEAMGVKTIVTCDPLDFDAARAAVSSVMDAPGVSAVIFESPCISLFRALEPAQVITEKCVGCETCIVKTGCPALVNDEGVTRIDAKLCFGCDLCVSYCPVSAIVTPREELSHPERAALRGAAR